MPVLCFGRVAAGAMAALALLLGLAAAAPTIDRQEVVQRHIVRLSGVGGLGPAATALALSPPCTVEGHWFDAHDKACHNQFTVTAVAASAALCPAAGRLHSFNATSQHAWTEVPVCSYANGSLWIGRTGPDLPGHASHQTGVLSKACDSLMWTDPSPLTQEYHWSRVPGAASCQHHRPPGPSPTTHPETPQTLTVGNGVIGFNADLTGFQTLNETYKMFPLTTLSDWGWHSSPFLAGGGSPFDAFTSLISTSLQVAASLTYPLNQSWAGGQWLRANPHRLDLIQVALRRQSATSAPLLPVDLSSGTRVRAMDHGLPGRRQDDDEQCERGDVGGVLWGRRCHRPLHVCAVIKS